MPLTTLFANYTPAQVELNARCRIILQESLSLEDWGIVSQDDRFVVNMECLRTIYAGEAATQSESLQVQLSNLKLVSAETLKSYWSRGITLQRKLAALTIAVSDATLSMWLLHGLPAEWEP